MSPSKKELPRGEENKRLRSQKAIQKLLDILEEDETFLIDDELFDKVSSYLEVRPLLPSILNHQSRSNVRKAQRALVDIEQRIDTTLRVQAGIRTRLRLFSQLEFEVRQFLYKHSLITPKSTRPAVESAIALVVPELVNCREEWKEFEELCRSVHKRLLDAKDTMKLLSKLDDNYRWANSDP